MALANLLSQFADVYINGAVTNHHIATPHAVEYLLTREDLLRLGLEEFE